MSKSIKEEFYDCVMSSYSDAVRNRRLHLAITDDEAYKLYWKDMVIKTTQEWIDRDRSLKGVNLEEVINHNPHKKTPALKAA